jgi:anthranilate synthase/aminodeoxychorismate synthase-like glutamine amidotransferase
MWVLIDNYDSFTHILHHYLILAGGDCLVVRNDAITIDELSAHNPERIIISPGPGTPADAGITLQVIEHFHKKVPILGVCLGHQALAVFFGARLYQCAYPMHGKTSLLNHNGIGIFRGLPEHFDVMRYHSLAVDRLEDTGLEAIAHTEDGTIMAVKHSLYRCVGVQFHPESVGTEHGLEMMKNWVTDQF